MNQLSFFDLDTRPFSHEAICDFVRSDILDDEDAGQPDAFSFSETKSGYSYSLYGKKVFELRAAKTPYMRVLAALDSASRGAADESETDTFARLEGNMSDLVRLSSNIVDLKHDIFRSLIEDTFACCSHFVECSDARHCLFPRDRFYNGCHYRKNLEVGRIFYGKNRNG